MSHNINYLDVLKRLTRELKQLLPLLIPTIIFAAISAITSLFTPILIGEFLDNVIYMEEAQVIVPILQLLTVYIIGAIAQYFMTYFANRLALLSSYHLRKKIYKKLESVPIQFYDTHAQGDIVSRYINDADFVSDGLVQGLSSIVNGIFIVIGSILLMAQLNLMMCLIVVACAPITFFVGRFVNLRIHKYFSEQSRLIGHMNGVAEELVNELTTIHLFAYNKQAEHIYEEESQKLRTIGTKATFFGALTNPSTRLVTNGSYILVGIVASYLAIRGEFGVGSISTFLLFSTLFARPFNDITSIITNIQIAFSSSERILELLDSEEETNETSSSQSPLYTEDFTFEHVDFSYDKKNLVIKNFDLHIPSQSKVAIVGKTGSGKTTLVNLLMRFYDVDKGNIYIDGIDLRTINKHELRSRFGMVLQDTYFFKESIYYNLGYGLNTIDKQKIEEACLNLGVDHFIQKLPNGYNTILNDDISLSEGQRQLLAITRVYIMNPTMFILDEATSSIDTRSEQQIQTLLDRMMEHKTSFVIAHRLSTIIHSDMIIMMEDGMIQEVGTHKELLKKKGKYFDLYMSQFQNDSIKSNKKGAM